MKGTADGIEQTTPDGATAMIETVFYHTHPSPVGELLLTSDGASITGLHMARASRPAHPGAGWRNDAEPFGEACAQLEAYFAGERTEFDLPLAPRGTAFQEKVWNALTSIPYGRTATYGEIAEIIGSPGAGRAVGSANNRNPIAIVIPCHRVIGADGSLTGYGGGLERKTFLLDLERGRSSGAADLLGSEEVGAGVVLC